MAFYNLLLRCRGLTWNIWRHYTCKSILPDPPLWLCGILSKFWFPSRFSGHRTQIYDPLQDSVDIPLHLRPVNPLSRQQRMLLSKQAPPGNKRLALLMLTLAQLGQQEMFTLAEDRRVRRQLRQYRSCQGMLQTHKLNGLPTEQLLQIQERVKTASESASTIAQTTLGTDTPVTTFGSLTRNVDWNRE